MFLIRQATVAVAAIFCAAVPLSAALAHSIAGNRIFPATLAIDDPGVSDELALPTITYLPDGSEADYAFNFAKRITPDFGVSIGDTYINAGDASGFDNLGVGFKYLGYINPVHEFMASLGLNIDVGNTGSVAIRASRFWTFTPSVVFGKGFGDLPTSADCLRPFAVTLVSAIMV